MNGAFDAWHANILGLTWVHRNPFVCVCPGSRYMHVPNDARIGVTSV